MVASSGVDGSGGGRRRRAAAPRTIPPAAAIRSGRNLGELRGPGSAPAPDCSAKLGARDGRRFTRARPAHTLGPASGGALLRSTPVRPGDLTPFCLTRRLAGRHIVWQRRCSSEAKPARRAAQLGRAQPERVHGGRARRHPSRLARGARAHGDVGRGRRRPRHLQRRRLHRRPRDAHGAHPAAPRRGRDPLGAAQELPLRPRPRDGHRPRVGARLRLQLRRGHHDRRPSHRRVSPPGAPGRPRGRAAGRRAQRHRHLRVGGPPRRRAGGDRQPPQVGGGDPQHRQAGRAPRRRAPTTAGS